MEPGNEMDALIAEKVMGATWVTEDEDQPEACPYLQTDDWIFYPSIYVGKRSAIINGCYAGGMPNYSGQIEYAWQVVEKIKKLSEYNGNKCATRDPWQKFCKYFTGDWDDAFPLAFFDVNPRSICVAALIALA